jgi:hypothetical protein
MIIVPVAYVVTSPRSETTQTPEQQSQQEKYNPEYWVIDQPFYSISDALNMTPYGVVTADYVDIESMTPQMIQWARQIKVDLVNYPIVSWMDSLYNSNTTKVYYGHLKEDKNESFLLLSTMFPEKNDFEYIVLPNSYIPILRRQEQGINGMYNIMGNPVIFAPPQTAIDVLNIINSLNKTATAYNQYEGLLDIVEPAAFQTVNSNVSFAKQFYMGVRETNGSYERTAAYLDINSSTLKKLNQLKANSTQRDFAQYNITRSGNYTIVKIVSPELLKVVNEEVS